MDVLKPQLLWINGRCYRVNECNDTNAEELNTRTATLNCYIEEDLYGDDDDDGNNANDEADNYDIQMIDDRFKSSFHVPKVFFALLIGTKGTTKKRIESETKTQIKIPQMGHDGNVDIIGNTRKNVCSARRRIEIMIIAARNKQQNTHFLCVPIIDDSIKKSFIQFKNSILQDKSNIGLDSSIFQNSDKLHLTIGTFCLMDNEDRSQAAVLLQDCQELIIQPILQQYGSIVIQMKGIEYMNDDPSAVDVLYGKVDSESLQLICDEMVNYFTVKGLMQKQFDRVKLHVTLMNSLFRKRSTDTTNTISNQNNSNNNQLNDQQLQKRETFDARNILKNYGNFNFGVQSLKEIHLSLRYSTACDGFYEATGILKI